MSKYTLTVVALLSTVALQPWLLYSAGEPSRDLARYALFAERELHAKGLTVESGDIGVNDGHLHVGSRALLAPESTVVGDRVMLGRGSMCGALFANRSRKTDGCGPAMALDIPVVRDVGAACGFPAGAFPACDKKKGQTVKAGKTLHLVPGTYGDLLVNGSKKRVARVVLAPGRYVFCSLRAKVEAVVEAGGPAQVYVRDKVEIESHSVVGPADGAPGPIDLFVRKSGVRIESHSRVVARLCAPEAELVAKDQTRLAGSFVAETIRIDKGATVGLVGPPSGQPIADAGVPAMVAVGATVTLDGTNSMDPDGNPLTFAWTLVTRPAGSTATLAGATTATPTFVADVAGVYVARLVVRDATLASDPDEVTITAGPSQPVADAGPDQEVAAGSLVELDGTRSVDPEGDDLTFAWEFVSRPTGSTAVLDDPESLQPTFGADLAGVYVLRLTVSDGTASASDEVMVTVGARCGDGRREDPEACDGTDLGGRTCIDEEFEDGTLTCTTGCMLDPTGCCRSTLHATGTWDIEFSGNHSGSVTADFVHDGTSLAATGTLSVDDVGQCATTGALCGSESQCGGAACVKPLVVSGAASGEIRCDTITFGFTEFATFDGLLTDGPCAAGAWTGVDGSHGMWSGCRSEAPSCGNEQLDGGEECDEGVANGTADSCCTASCTLRAAGSVCRPAAGPCDVAEGCTGVIGPCPVDGFAPSDAVCRSAAGVCDVAESCPGTSAACSADALQSAGTVCRAAAGECDAPDRCDGALVACPADAKVPSGSACTADTDPCTVDQCDGTRDACQHTPGTCDPCGGPCATGTVCNVPEECCVVDVSGAWSGTSEGQVCNSLGCVPVTVQWSETLTQTGGSFSGPMFVHRCVEYPTGVVCDDLTTTVSGSVGCDGSIEFGALIGFNTTFTGSLSDGCASGQWHYADGVNVGEGTFQGCKGSCGTCGDGVRQAGCDEQCDRTDLSGQTCVTAGFEDGTLRCTAGCALDTAACCRSDFNVSGHWSVTYAGTYSGTVDADFVHTGTSFTATGTQTVNELGLCSVSAAVCASNAQCPSGQPCVKPLTFPPGTASGDIRCDQFTFGFTGAATFAGQITEGPCVVDGTWRSTDGTASGTWQGCLVDNRAPVANAGADQLVTVGATASLDGTGSSDPDGDALTYQWTLASRPPGSGAALSSPTAAAPTFTADVAGTYTVQLVVSDGTLLSPADTLTVTTRNRAPAADAGPDQANVALGTTVQLNGNGSSDPDGNSITYQWSFDARPAGSTTTLQNASAVNAAFAADAPGTYRVRLRVSDGEFASEDTVQITTANRPPVARAGADQTAATGATVNLNGSGSSDPDANPLTFSWTLTTRPAGSAATLSGATTATPSFVPDQPGRYVARLVVNDGQVDSAPDDVAIDVARGGITLALSNTNLIGAGRPATLAITLGSPAPAGGATVTVTSDDTGVVTVAPPASATIAAGSQSGQVTLNGVAAGTTTMRATATGYTDGVLDVSVTQNVLTVPATLNVPLSQSASLPVTIAPNPAPAGGLAVTVVSDAPGVIDVLTPTVTIPQGAFSANATIRGSAIGSATLTASSTGFASASSRASSAGNLNITQSSATFTPGFRTNITVQLESVGAPVSAPAPGLDVTLTPGNPACLSAPSPVTIATGLVNVSVQLSYGGTATLPCTTTLMASAAGLTPDTINVTVNPNPGITMQGLPTTAGTVTVGAGLQVDRGQFGNPLAAVLSIANHGGVTVHIESSNPAVLRVARNATTPGSAAIDVVVPNGSIAASYVLEGVDGATGTATVTASASGFTNGTGMATVVQPGVQILSLPTSLTTLDPDRAFSAYVGIPTAGNAGIAAFQAVRAGGSLTVTLANGNAAVAQLVTMGGTGQSRMVTIGAGQQNSPGSVATGGVAFDPLAVGSTMVSASIPGFVTTTAGTVAVAVSAPTLAITMQGLPMTAGTVTVGAGLQVDRGQFGNPLAAVLSIANHGGVTVHIESSNPAVLRVARNATTPGSAAIDVVVPNGSIAASYVLEGVDGATGTATVTASASGFTNGTGMATVVQPGVQILSLPTSLTTLDPDRAFSAYVGIPTAGNAGIAAFQAVRAGGSLTVTLANSNAAVAQLVTTAGTGQSRTVTIGAGQSNSPGSVATGGVAFDPLAVGSTMVSASIPGFVTTTAGTVAVAVSAPTLAITMQGLPMTAGTVTVGAGLQVDRGQFGNPLAAVLSIANHGGVTVHIESSNPAVLRVARNATTPGSAAIDVVVPNGSIAASYVLEGVDGATGTATVTASASGFTNGTGMATVVQPGVQILSLPTSLTTLDPDRAFSAYVGIPTAGNAGIAAFQAVRAGGSLTVTLANSNAAVAQLVTTAGTGQSRTVTIGAGQSNSPGSVATGGVAFDPLAVGSTMVSASIPGFVTTTAGTVAVAMSTPGITFPSLPVTVGAGLQTSVTRQGFGISVQLGASNHGGVMVHIESSNPGVLRVAPNATTPGTAAIDLQVNNGSIATTNFFVQGQDALGTVTLTASAPGFLNGSGTVTVAQAGLALASLPTSISAGAADREFNVQVGVPQASSTALDAVQAVRVGSSLAVNVSNANATVAQLKTSAGAGQTRTVTIAAGQSNSPTTVATGGVAFDPLGQGSTTVVAASTGLITTGAGTVNVTVNP